MENDEESKCLNVKVSWDLGNIELDGPSVERELNAIPLVLVQWTILGGREKFCICILYFVAVFLKLCTLKSASPSD